LRCEALINLRACDLRLQEEARYTDTDEKYTDTGATFDIMAVTGIQQYL